MKKLPLGIQEFSEIRSKGFLYVDKTEHIYQLAEQGKYYFLSRPRRFGKSLLVNTFKELFLGNQHLFEGLWIFSRWNWEQKNPVILLDFSKIGIREFGFSRAITEELKSLFKHHDLQATAGSPGQLFRELIQKLHEKHGEQVVILIDEYDKPILDFLDNPQKLEEQREALKSFYAVIKGTDASIRLFFITGVSKFSKVSIFSDLNNITDISFTSSFQEILGWTKEELLSYFGSNLDTLSAQLSEEKENLLTKIQVWYNGYSWGGKSKVYNPYSVLSLFFSGKFSNYWFETGTPTFLTKLLKKYFYYDLRNLRVSPMSLNNLSVDAPNIEALLLQTGYLTIVGENEMTGSYILDYPNREVRLSFDYWLFAEYSGTTPNTASPTVENIYNALMNADMDAFRTTFNAIFAKIPQDYFVLNREKFYHAIVFLTFDIMGFYTDIEQNSGMGRLDAVVKIEDKIFVMEFKLDKSPEEALAQIKERGYHRRFATEGKQVHLMGINFNSKRKEMDDILLESI